MCYNPPFPPPPLVVFQSLSTPLPHSGVSPSWSLPTDSHSPLARPLLRLQLCLNIYMCEHVRAQRMARLSHDWITIHPPLPSTLLAPLAPVDPVLNYLIDDSSPVILLLLFSYCYNTTPPPPLTPSWQLIPSVGGP